MTTAPSPTWDRAPPTELLLALAVTRLEARDPATGVQDLLLARVERVAGGADLDVDGTGGLGAVGGEAVPAAAGHLSGDVLGVDAALQCLASRCGRRVPCRSWGEPEPDSTYQCARRADQLVQHLRGEVCSTRRVAPTTRRRTWGVQRPRGRGTRSYPHTGRVTCAVRHPFPL